MIVSRFGLHVAGGIPFLLQKSGVQNLISPNLRAPFEPQIRPRNARCQHNIDLDHIVEAPSWVHEPLAKVFWPVPRREGSTAKMIVDVDNTLGPSLEALARLSTPTEVPVRPVWWRKALQLAPLYELTNLGPLVWTAGNVNRTREIERHIELAAASGRRILIVCESRVPIFQGVEWVEPFHVDTTAPFEEIGAGLLRRHMEAIQNGQG
jgi:hypothetical protein